ncbi:MAG: hydrogenase formation protein HypD [Chthoniobacterales bacterium]|nr:hydrogenase formation protein HypD [Chthoniobacterales bacterium]
MNLLAPYRDAQKVQSLAAELARISKKPAAIMEICGGQTHAILKYGLEQLLPKHIELLHGPGCPVCVTPASILDHAIWLCLRHNITLCSFGDMLRVPGQLGSLAWAKSQGGDVRIVYSPLDAVEFARQNPEKKVVFLAIGFETTAPANALAARRAKELQLQNFWLLVSHVLVPPAICALLESPECRIQGFLAAGHVCTVMGFQEYQPIAKKYKVPIVVTGFEPVDIFRGILQCIRQIEAGLAEVENAYERVVRPEGNPTAKALIEEVFEVCDREWRGIGILPKSGFRLRDCYAEWDASRKLPTFHQNSTNNNNLSTHCRSGEVLQGKIKPPDCPFFGKECTPENPLGATMVSSEGACAAYYTYHYKAKP